MEDLSKIVAEKGKEFIFRLQNGKEVARASSLMEFISKVKTVPIESLEYHAMNHHFSPWLRYLKQDKKANELDALKSKGERLRLDILNILQK